jgi:hypothetical protein
VYIFYHSSVYIFYHHSMYINTNMPEDSGLKPHEYQFSFGGAILTIPSIILLL